MVKPNKESYKTEANFRQKLKVVDYGILAISGRNVNKIS